MTVSEQPSPIVVHGKLPARISIHCTSIDGCGTLSRVYRVEPTTQIGAFKYCPVCGASVMPYQSADETGWEALAVAYGMDVPQIRAVYAGWNPHEYYRFSDYVAALREEARTGVRPAPKPSPHVGITASPDALRRAAPLVTDDLPMRPRMKVPR
jgi:hypothetical protein